MSSTKNQIEDTDIDNSDDDRSVAAGARKDEPAEKSRSVGYKSAWSRYAEVGHSPSTEELLGAATKRQRVTDAVAQHEDPSGSQPPSRLGTGYAYMDEPILPRLQNPTGYIPEPTQFGSVADSRYQRRNAMIRRQEEWVAALRREATLRLAAREGLSNRMALEQQCREIELQELLRRRYPDQFDNLSVMRPPGPADLPSQRSLGFPADACLPIDHSSMGQAQRLLGRDNSSLSQHSSGRSVRAEPSDVAAAATTAPSFRLAPGEGMQLLLPNDKALLSDYQTLIRESLEFFEVQASDMVSSVPGRKKNIELGQVGIRCRYCAHRPAHWRGRGAVYFPGNLASVYQAAQNMASNHLLKACEDLPPDVTERFAAARQKQKEETRRSGGKTYWVETSRHVGLEEREGRSGVWFKKS